MARLSESTETLESVLARAPSSSFVSPEPGSKVRIRPLKRLKSASSDDDGSSTEDGAVGSSDEMVPHASRELDFDSEKVEPKKAVEEEARDPPAEEEEEVETTQPWPEREEGEIPPVEQP